MLSPSSTFGQFLDTWISKHAQEVKNQDKSRDYVSMLRSFHLRYWKALNSLKIYELSKHNWFHFYSRLSSFGLSPGYKKLILTTLKSAVFQACKDAGVPPPDYWPKVHKADYQNKAPRVLTEAQQEEVLAHVPPPHRPMAMAYFYHGLRPCEIRSITSDCYNPGNKTLTVPTAKGGKDRVILLENDLVELLGEPKRGLLFPNPNMSNGSPYARSTMYRIIKGALTEAGYGEYTPNQAGRHSAATNYLKRGASTRQTQYLLGHSKVETTERYTHPDVMDQENLRRE